MYTFPGGVHGIFAQFWILYGSLGVPSGPIRLVAALRFKILDSQPDSSNMGPVSIDFHEIWDFLKSWGGFLTCIYRVFGPGASQFTFSRFPVGTKKNRDEKLRRFVVVSPRGVPSLTVSGPFTIFLVRPFFRPLPFAYLNSGSLVFTKFGHQPYLSAMES